MNSKTRALTEASLLTALICIIGLAGVYIPFVSIISYFTYAPLIVLGKRHGAKYTFVSLAAASALFSLFTDPLTMLSLLLVSGISSAVMGALFYYERTPAQILGAGILTALASAVVWIALAQMISGIQLLDAMKDMLDESFKLSQSMFGGMGQDPEQAAKAKELIETLKQQMLMLFPAMIAIGAVFTAFLNYWFATLIFRKLRIAVPSLRPFREFELPRSIILGTLLFYLLALAVSALKIVDSEALMANIQILMIFTFAVQGLAVAVWFMHRRSVSRGISIVAAVLLLMSNLGMTLLFMLGVIETAFHLRARTEARNRQGGA